MSHHRIMLSESMIICNLLFRNNWVVIVLFAACYLIDIVSISIIIIFITLFLLIENNYTLCTMYNYYFKKITIVLIFIKNINFINDTCITAVS